MPNEGLCRHREAEDEKCLIESWLPLIPPARATERSGSGSSYARDRRGPESDHRS
jgi:hypothetical protein